jgi:hypothetical protein
VLRTNGRSIRALTRTFSIRSRCAAAAIVVAATHHLSPLGMTPAFGEVPLPTACERRLDGVYETRGPASIDRLGDRYVLTVRCEGVHQIYVRNTAVVDLGPFAGKTVRVRYRYAEERNPRARCVRPPCPPVTERVVEITEIEELITLDADLDRQ